MHKSVCHLLLLLTGLHLAACSSGQSVLEMGSISGYDKNVRDHIIFLNFKITDQGRGKNEKVKLITATSGNGRMKNLRAPVNYPYQIKAIPRYTSGRLETEIVLEHPLFRSVEVPSQDGTLSKSSLNAKEGVISIRFQEDKTMDRIELYSVTPDRGSVKIYTLNLKI